MELNYLLKLLIIGYLIETGFGIICKCTQSSAKTPCTDGICETDSKTSACLMLDHPTSGRHYACTTSQLNEGECVEKTSKSGATVKVCSCHSSDYCNFKLWPIPEENTDENSEEQQMIGTGNPRRQVTTHQIQQSPSKAMSKFFQNPIMNLFVSSFLFIVFSFIFSH